MHLLKRNIHPLSRVIRLVQLQLMLSLAALPTDAAQQWGLLALFLLRHTVSRAMSHCGVTTVDRFATKLADCLRPRCSDVAWVCGADVSPDVTRREAFLTDRTDVNGFAPLYLMELNQLAVLWTMSNRMHIIY